jgi:hypothetical protein
MTQLRISVKIDGQPYTDEQLARYQYERTLHGLHELKALGADVRDGDQELSHIDINWLEPQRAEQISLDVRAALGEQRVLELFKDVLADTDRRWRAFNEGYVEGDVQTATIEVEAVGVGIQETIAVVGGAKNERDALGVMPEHYIVIGDIATGQRGMETFGMFGEPAYVHGIASAEVPAFMPFEKDPAYPITIFGQMLLKSDDFPINVGALHQVRPSADGFSIKSTFSCPRKAPKAIVDGHKLHFAIEITNSIKVAYAQKNPSESRARAQ